MERKDPGRVVEKLRSSVKPPVGPLAD